MNKSIPFGAVTIIFIILYDKSHDKSGGLVWRALYWTEFITSNITLYNGWKFQHKLRSSSHSEGRWGVACLSIPWF